MCFSSHSSTRRFRKNSLTRGSSTPPFSPIHSRSHAGPELSPDDECLLVVSDQNFSGVLRIHVLAKLHNLSLTDAQ